MKILTNAILMSQYDTYYDYTIIFFNSLSSYKILLEIKKLAVNYFKLALK